MNVLAEKGMELSQTIASHKDRSGQEGLVEVVIAA